MEDSDGEYGDEDEEDQIDKKGDEEHVARFKVYMKKYTKERTWICYKRFAMNFAIMFFLFLIFVAVLAIRIFHIVVVIVIVLPRVGLIDGGREFGTLISRLIQANGACDLWVEERRGERRPTCLLKIVRHY